MKRPRKRELLVALCTASHARNCNGWLQQLPRSACRRPVQNKFRCVRPIASDSSNSINENDWQVGDVYGDLDRLEQAIRRSNAEQDKQHRERLETLDYFAQQRQLLRPMIRQKILLPLLVTWLTSCLIPRPIAPVLSRLLQVQLYSMVLLPPIVLLAALRRRTRFSDNDDEDNEGSREPPPELRDIDPEYYKFVSDWQDPAESTQNTVLCLTEQWTSAVALTLLLLVLLPATTATAAATTTTPLHGRWMTAALVRLAAWASVHQYPQLSFELWHRQERPYTWPVALLQSMMRPLGTAPWWVAVTAGIGLAGASRMPVLMACSTVAALVLLWERQPKLGNTLHRHRKSIIGGLLAGCVLVGWKRYAESLRWTGLWLQSFSLQHDLPALFSLRVLRRLAAPTMRLLTIVASVTLPLIHLRAWSRIFQVVYTHNLSLSLDPMDFSRQLQRPDVFAWRYKLRWRTPQRVGVTWKEWKQRFWYWLFFTGSVQDKLRRQFDPRKKSRENRDKDTNIWERLKADKKGFIDRSLWKQQAMEQLAATHQQDYEKNTFLDPLGIAVYKSLGIGLGFNFDHMSELKPGDKPSTRRLQARAAKSAVRHVQQLYNVQEAQDVLDKIEDPDERERKKVEMRESTQTEIDTIARRLSELIPTDMVLATERRTSIEQFSESSEYERTSSNEYQLKSPRASSPTVRDLLSRTREDDKVDYLNPSGDAKQDGLDDAEPMSQEEEDAFIEAWIQQRSRNKTSDSASEDGEKSDDDGIKTVLV